MESAKISIIVVFSEQLDKTIANLPEKTNKKAVIKNLKKVYERTIKQNREFLKPLKDLDPKVKVFVDAEVYE